MRKLDPRAIERMENAFTEIRIISDPEPVAPIQKSLETEEAPKKLDASTIVKSFLAKGAIRIVYEGENDEKITLEHDGTEPPFPVR